MTTVYKFKAYYTDAGVGTVQDPAPTCTVINMADDSKLADAQATTASTNMPGLYSYEYSGNDGLDCVAWFKTTDTGCDVKELASYVSEKITTNLPAIKTDTAAILLDTGTDGVVLKAAGLDTDAVNEIVDQVWNEAIADHTTATTFGGKNQKVVPSETINDYKADVSGLATSAELTAIKGAGWTDETLVALMTAIEGISAGSGASVADILNALLASYTVSGSVGESLGRLDNIQAKTDLITTGTTITLASPVSGSTITAQRGDTLSAALENIGSVANHSKIYFTVKSDPSDADSAALIQIEHTAGLLYINGAAAVTAANGTLAVNDEPTGDITVALDEAETAKLDPGVYFYDVQIVRSAGTVSTLTEGSFTVSADVTRAVT